MTAAALEVPRLAPEKAAAPDRRRWRALVATPVVEEQVGAWREWAAALAAQRTELAWDLLLVDSTDRPSPGYVDRLASWCKGEPLRDQHGRQLRNRRGQPRWQGPFGHGRAARLARFGWDVDGQAIRDPAARRALARELAWGKFRNWSSYDYMLSLEPDVLVAPDALQQLFAADLPWAAAWLDGPEPQVFHSLDLEHWRQAPPLASLAHQVPPGPEPFPCAATHLDCTLLRGDVVRSVPYRLTNAGDYAYSWDCLEAGYQPVCVPAVRAQAAGARSQFTAAEVQ